MVDYDGNGTLDVLSGSWPGQLFLFRRSSDGTFLAREEILTEDAESLRLGNGSTPFAYDWDHDGDLDLVVGTKNQGIFLSVNRGSRSEPAYAAAEQLLNNEEPLVVGESDLQPVVADWNGDGLHDLVVGTGSGRVLWLQNHGTQASATWKAAEVLLEAEDGEGSRGEQAKVCVTDYNGDGLLDLLVGEFRLREVPPDEEEVRRKNELKDQQRELIEEYAVVRKTFRAVVRDDAATDQAVDAAKQAYDDSKRRLRELTAEIATLAIVRREVYGNVWFYPRREAGSPLARVFSE